MNRAQWAFGLSVVQQSDLLALKSLGTLLIHGGMYSSPQTVFEQYSALGKLNDHATSAGVTSFVH